MSKVFSRSYYVTKLRDKGWPQLSWTDTLWDDDDDDTINDLRRLLTRSCLNYLVVILDFLFQPICIYSVTDIGGMPNEPQ